MTRDSLTLSDALTMLDSSSKQLIVRMKEVDDACSTVEMALHKANVEFDLWVKPSVNHNRPGLTPGGKRLGYANLEGYGRVLAVSPSVEIVPSQIVALSSMNPTDRAQCVLLLPDLVEQISEKTREHAAAVEDTFKTQG